MTFWALDAEASRGAAGRIEAAADDPASSAEPRRASSLPPSEPTAANAYLHAGQVVVSPVPCTITTIVGSCVSVYLFDPVRRAGGGNHYVLPASGGPYAASSRFGDVAIMELIRRLVALGCREVDLQAKLVGGASILQASEHIGAESLGTKNVLVARRLLAARRIVVLGEDVGGSRGRKVLFRTDTGEIWVRKL